MAATTILNQQNIDDSKAAVNTYRSNCDSEFENVKSTVTNLVADGFIGEAANGFMEFFNAITPRISTDVTSAEESICTMLLKIIDNIEEMIKTYDPEIGENNKSTI